MSRWAEQLNESLDTIEDYVENFLCFLYESKLPNSAQFEYQLRLRIKAILNTFKTEFDINPKNLVAFARDSINDWGESEPRNVYGSDFANYVDSLEDSNDGEWMLRKHFLSNKLLSHSKDFTAGINDLSETIESIYREIFVVVFDFELDVTVDWQAYLLEKLLVYLNNSCDMEDVANLLFVGFGSNDWTPKALQVNLRSFNNLNPRASISYVTSPEFKWFLALAQDSHVETFLRGVDGNYRELVFGLLDEAKNDIENQTNRIKNLEFERIDRMRSKVDQFSQRRLEFVARSFVEMEGLGSFLVEYLPSVGGKTTVVSMTR